MDLLGDGLDDANDDVLQSLSLRVIVQDEAVSLLGVRTAERWSTHAGVDGSQVVMESVKVLEEEEPLLLYRYWSIYKRRPHTQVKDCSLCIMVHKILPPIYSSQLDTVKGCRYFSTEQILSSVNKKILAPLPYLSMENNGPLSIDG